MIHNEREREPFLKRPEATPLLFSRDTVPLKHLLFFTQSSKALMNKNMKQEVHTVLEPENDVMDLKHAVT